MKKPADVGSSMREFKAIVGDYYHTQSNLSGEGKRVFEVHHMLWYVLLNELENEKKDGRFCDLGVCHIASAYKSDSDLKVDQKIDGQTVKNPIVEYFIRREFSPHIRLLSITGNKGIKSMGMTDFAKHFTGANLMLSDLMYVDRVNLTKHVRISQTSSSGSDSASSGSNDLTNSSASESDDEVQKRTVDGTGKRLHQEKE